MRFIQVMWMTYLIQTINGLLKRRDENMQGHTKEEVKNSKITF